MDRRGKIGAAFGPQIAGVFEFALGAAQRRLRQRQYLAKQIGIVQGQFAFDRIAQHVLAENHEIVPRSEGILDVLERREHAGRQRPAVRFGQFERVPQ